MNFFLPMTPPTTGPVLMPMRTLKSSPCRTRSSSMRVEHVERELGEGEGVVLPAVEATHDHVRVADGLDLLEAELVEQIVERREQLVQPARPAARATGARRAA